MLDLWFRITFFFAGLWPIIAKFGLAGITVAACLAFSWFSPVFKKTALWIALAIVVYAVAYSIGVKDGEARIQAQWDAAVSQTIDVGQKARADAEHYDASTTPDELRHDPYNRDNRRRPANAGKGGS